MELIDRYVAQVGRQLPEKMRADIESEICSTLEDMVEDRSRKAGRPADEALVGEVLKEYGSPGKVAASYLPPRYLIGPRLFPQFELVLRIVLAVLVGVGLFRLGMAVLQEPRTTQAFIELAGKSLLEILGSALSAFGNVVLVFAILDRVLKNKEMAAETWDPRSLEPISEPERIKVGELIAEVVFTLGVVLVLNVYPQIIRLGFFSQGQWTFVPVLSDAFFSYLPWINLACALQIIQNLVLMRQGRWQPATRWSGLAVDIFGVGLTYAMLTGPALIDLSAATLLAAGPFDASSADLIAKMTKFAVYLGLTIALVVESIEIVKTLYTLIFKRRRPSPAQA